MQETYSLLLRSSLPPIYAFATDNSASVIVPHLHSLQSVSNHGTNSVPIVLTCMCSGPLQTGLTLVSVRAVPVQRGATPIKEARSAQVRPLHVSLRGWIGRAVSPAAQQGDRRGAAQPLHAKLSWLTGGRTRAPDLDVCQSPGLTM